MNIIITGATSGIGKATTEYFIQNGVNHNIWIIGRREEKLIALQKGFNGLNNCTLQYTPLDIRDKAAIEQLASTIKSEWGHIDLLVNNAGLALGVSPIHEGNIEDWETMIDTNIKGLLYITRAIVPIFVKQQFGHIINIGSTAGKMTYKNGNVYCATKFAVDAIGQSLRIDLLPHNVKVTNINPGMVNTEFSKVRLKCDQETATKVYDDYDVLVAEDIAQTVHYCATLPAHICINDLTITCTQQANSVYKHPSKK